MFKVVKYREDGEIKIYKEKIKGSRNKSGVRVDASSSDIAIRFMKMPGVEVLWTGFWDE